MQMRGSSGYPRYGSDGTLDLDCSLTKPGNTAGTRGIGVVLLLRPPSPPFHCTVRARASKRKQERPRVRDATFSPPSSPRCLRHRRPARSPQSPAARVPAVDSSATNSRLSQSWINW